MSWPIEKKKTRWTFQQHATMTSRKMCKLSFFVTNYSYSVLSRYISTCIVLLSRGIYSFFPFNSFINLCINNFLPFEASIYHVGMYFSNPQKDLWEEENALLHEGWHNGDQINHVFSHRIPGILLMSINVVSDDQCGSLIITMESKLTMFSLIASQGFF